MKTLKRFLRKSAAPQRGFTLLEMVVVLAIIALLMLIVIPNLNSQRERAAKRSNIALEHIVHNQAEMYVNDRGGTLEKVTLDDLKQEKYLNENQYDKAKALAINPAVEPVEPTENDAS